MRPDEQHHAMALARMLRFRVLDPKGRAPTFLRRWVKPVLIPFFWLGAAFYPGVALAQVAGQLSILWVLGMSAIMVVASGVRGGVEHRTRRRNAKVAELLYQVMSRVLPFSARGERASYTLQPNTNGTWRHRLRIPMRWGNILELSLSVHNTNDDVDVSIRANTPRAVSRKALEAITCQSPHRLKQVVLSELSPFDAEAFLREGGYLQLCPDMDNIERLQIALAEEDVQQLLGVPRHGVLGETSIADFFSFSRMEPRRAAEVMLDLLECGAMTLARTSKPLDLDALNLARKKAREQARDTRGSSLLLEGTLVKALALKPPEGHPDASLELSNWLLEVFAQVQVPGATQSADLSDSASSTLIPVTGAPPPVFDLASTFTATFLETPLSEGAPIGIRDRLIHGSWGPVVSLSGFVVLFSLAMVSFISSPDFASAYLMLPFALLMFASVSQLDLYSWLSPISTRRAAPETLTFAEGELCLGRARIVLERPVNINLTQDPETLMLNVELTQASHHEPVRLRFQTPLSARIPQLDAYAMRAPVVLAEDFQRWVWPLLRQSAAMSGKPLHWEATAASGEAQDSVMVQSEVAVARS